MARVRSNETRSMVHRARHLDADVFVSPWLHGIRGQKSPHIQSGQRTLTRHSPTFKKSQHRFRVVMHARGYYTLSHFTGHRNCGRIDPEGPATGMCGQVPQSCRSNTPPRMRGTRGARTQRVGLCRRSRTAWAAGVLADSRVLVEDRALPSEIVSRAKQ